MKPSTVQETVTVTAEAPLLNVTTSSLGGNVDPTQVQELPANGRNWMALALLAPGSRTSSGERRRRLPDRNGGEAREFQLNMDGQQVSNEIGTGNQPRYSQDAIAEFQFLTNRFDATQGRSSGVQVNVITKSGTNQLSGLFRTNFRHNRFNAGGAGSQARRADQQPAIQRAAGGPIVRDKLHYFGNFEYEREPRSSIWNTPYPVFNKELHGDRTIKLTNARGDYQLSNAIRLMGKGTWGRFLSRSARLRRTTARRPRIRPASTTTKAWAADARDLESRCERGEGRLCVLQPGQRQPDDLVEPLAEGERHHHGVAAHLVHGLQRHRQRESSPAPGPDGLDLPRRLHLLV